jgi:hypothetical protein
MYGPEYNVTSAKLKKFRATARNGLSSLDKDQRHAYGMAVSEAIRAMQRSELNAACIGPKNPRPNCASGTTHTTGKAISEAIRDQQRHALLAYPDQQRRKRTDDELRYMYKQAMAKKQQEATNA